MKKEISTIIVAPDIKPHQQYKTVYILHGYSGNPERTLKQDIPDLQAKAKAFNTIYILPDGNYNSWYVDSPVDKKSQYKTFIGSELVQYIDGHYPTKAEKIQRNYWVEYGRLRCSVYRNFVSGSIRNSRQLLWSFGFPDLQ